jgi:SAM-dependent methyltransferase
LEISPSALDNAREKRLPHANFELFDGYAISFADRQFALAILSHVIEHVEHPRQLIYEALRVSKNVFIEVPLEGTLRLPSDFVFDPVGHINFYNVATIRSLVQSCGAQILAGRLSHGGRAAYVYQLGRAKGALAYLLKELGLRFVATLASQFCTYHYALVCRRGGE